MITTVQKHLNLGMDAYSGRKIAPNTGANVTKGKFI